VARGHQKYFCVQKDEDTLLPHYLCVANTANDPKVVAKGNDRVMRARLSDARFFFEEDKKVSFDTRVEKLAGIVFHNRLGTVRQKVDRIAKLTARIAADLALPAAETELAVRAAQLCKADLVALMVGEFPELQGEMGRAYAIAAGEDARVADAIRDHYKPAGAKDDVAPTAIAAVVGLADRLDTLVGCFAVGLSPTGAADPFALRRACLGILRTLMDKGQASESSFGKVDWRAWLGAAYDGFAGTTLDLTREETVAKVELFAAERLRGVLAGDSSNSVADAVLTGVTRAPGSSDAGAPVLAYPAIAGWKARELAKVVEAGKLGTARTVAKRLRGIAGQAGVPRARQRRRRRRRRGHRAPGSPDRRADPRPRLARADRFRAPRLRSGSGHPRADLPAQADQRPEGCGDPAAARAAVVRGGLHAPPGRLQSPGVRPVGDVSRLG
jgi:glycyl-tRNA synthetase beta chain